MIDVLVAAGHHVASRGTYGYRRVHAELTMGMDVSVSSRLVFVLMHNAGLYGLLGPTRIKRLRGVVTADELVPRPSSSVTGQRSSWRIGEVDRSLVVERQSPPPNLARMKAPWREGVDMSRIALTGGRGFLGWHARYAAASCGDEATLIPVGNDLDLALAAKALKASSRLVTVAGATHAEHFHRRKVERIVPLASHVTVALRRMFTLDVMTIDLDASKPTAVDTPTLWTHSFRNPGPDERLLMVWASPFHDTNDPDTYPEAV